MAKPKLLVDKPYVEIGGVKWATMNIGANSETDYGLYFQWGDTAGYTSSQVGANTTANKKPFTWADCALHNGTTSSGYTSFTKYNGRKGDALRTLEQCDDAAAANWGGNWRMPTREEFMILCNSVNARWATSYNGNNVRGLVFTDKNDSSKELFFPAAGACYNGSVHDAGSGIFYWSSSLYYSGVYGAYSLYYRSSYIDYYYCGDRSSGGSVRPVYDPT